MPAAPRGPRQHAFHALLRGQHEAPEAAPHRADTQWPPSPRLALRTAQLLGWGEGRVFLSAASDCRWTARRTVQNAYAHRASGLWRYHPAPLRPAYCSSPPSPWAAATPLSTLQRLPATRTTVSRALAWGANTTEAVRSVSALPLRRTNSQRRHAGGRGGARGSPRHASQRRPLVPAPALRRVPPSGGRVATTVVPGGCCQPRQTSAVPETAQTSACARSAHQPRRRRSAP
jgi:hypothetical protein